MELPNYTGPYISDGKIQSSVEFGTTEPKDALDALSRLHDSAYARFADAGRRRAADIIYAREAKKLVGQFPQLAAAAVTYGNQVGRSLGKLVAGGLNPMAFLVAALQNMMELHDFLLHQIEYERQVLAYYATDPVVFKHESPVAAVDVPYDPQVEVPIYTEAQPAEQAPQQFSHEEPPQQEVAMPPIAVSEYSIQSQSMPSWQLDAWFRPVRKGSRKKKKHFQYRSARA